MIIGVTTCAVEMLPQLSETVLNFFFVTLNIFAMIFIVWPVLYHNSTTVKNHATEAVTVSMFLEG